MKLSPSTNLPAVRASLLVMSRGRVELAKPKRKGGPHCDATACEAQSPDSSEWVRYASIEHAAADTRCSRSAIYRAMRKGFLVQGWAFRRAK